MGYRGSTTIACLNPSGTYRLQKLGQTTIGNSPVSPPQRRPDLNQRASTEPGAIQQVSNRQVAAIYCTGCFVVIMGRGSKAMAVGSL